MSTARHAYDYGHRARIGVATPQANPTVEGEFAILYPRSVSVQATRLTSPSRSPDERLVAYIEDLDNTVKTYGTMALSAFGFACTGSSYLVGATREKEIVDRLEQALAYPVSTTTHAILAALNAMNLSKVALLAPYPDSLIEAGETYWSNAGLEITTTHRIVTRSDNTETIYELSSGDAADTLATFDPKGAEVILLSGTGMPSLACLGQHASGLPIISSNACLAWRLLHLAGASDLCDAAAPFITGWQGRLAEALR